VADADIIGFQGEGYSLKVKHGYTTRYPINHTLNTL